MAGTYSDIIFSKESNNKFKEITESFGLEKDFKDAYHCTLIYSKKKIPYYKTSKGKKQDKKGSAESKISKLVKIEEFGHFDTDEGKNLHVVLECAWCETQFNRAMKSGGTSDYDSYTAHVTLMYDCGDFTVDDEKGAEYIGETIEIVEERISPLNETWVEDSKIEESEIAESIEEGSMVSIYANTTHFELAQYLNQSEKDIKKRDQILNDPKALKERLKKLEKLPSATASKQVKQISKELKIPESTIVEIDEEGRVSLEKLKSMFNLKKIKTIGDGYTSYIFNDPVDKKKVLGFTLDSKKIKWMMANKDAFGFIMIDQVPYNKGNVVYIYSMNKFSKTIENAKMKVETVKDIHDDVIVKFKELIRKKGFGKVTVKDLDWIMYTVENKELQDILKKLKDTFNNDKDAALDLHRGQWAESDSGKIILFDPIINLDAINGLSDFNDLDLSSKFTNMLDNIFGWSNSKYLDKIKKRIKKL